MRLLISALFDESSPFDYIVDKRINSDDPDIFKQVVQPGTDVALIVWGGEDIGTSIYGQKPSKYTLGAEPSLRDKLEIAMANAAMSMSIPIIGVCRGSQLMCALSGGTLIQHVTKHAGWGHDCVTSEGVRFYTNSVHHQMMNPFKVDHELLAWVPEKISTIYIGDAGKPVEEAYLSDFKEPEIVWFPKTKALCIQGHPEYSNAQNGFIRQVLKFTEKYIFPVSA